LLSVEEIKLFYRNWEGKQVHRDWPWIWRKEYRIETVDGRFICLNRVKNRLNFRVLKELCVDYAHAHVYMSALNWVRAERVGLKKDSL
jgi:hypothetical protein